MAAAAGGAFNYEAFAAHIDANKAEWIAKLAEAVAIPSVSGDAGRRPECVRMMEWAKAEIEALGGKAELHDIGTHKAATGETLPLPPLVTAVFGADPKKKTICLYGHLDVQPAEVASWAGRGARLADGSEEKDPFKLFIDEQGRMWGRGSTDDKGPVLAWLWAIKAYQALGWELPCNLRFVLEGMEESGSEGLDEWIAAHPAFFEGVDYTCISDNYWLSSSKPCLTYGLRGLCYFFVHIKCAGKDLHSGVYGGVVHEAMHDMMKLLGSLNNADGSIAVPGIMDRVRPMTPAEEATYAAIDFDPEDFRKEAGAPKALRFASKQDVLTHRWRYPTLSIHGVEGAWAGSGAKTVIPADVIGKFSLRIVPDMLPEEVEAAVRAHLEAAWAKLCSPNVMSLEMHHGAAAWVSDFTDSSYQAAARAIKRTFGVEPDYTREGGSIPVTLSFERATRKSVMLLPIGGCDDGAHSQAEKFNVLNYINGIKVLGTYLHEVASA